MGSFQRPALIPSEAYKQWFKDVLTLKPVIHAKLEGLPISEPVSIQALVYRDALTGDWTGYVDAIADAIQTDVWQCQAEGCKARTTSRLVPAACPKCGERVKIKHVRKGLAIILDDKQIQDWDGTRLLKDSSRPRIELTITTIPRGCDGDCGTAASAVDAAPGPARQASCREESCTYQARGCCLSQAGGEAGSPGAIRTPATAPIGYGVHQDAITKLIAEPLIEKFNKSKASAAAKEKQAKKADKPAAKKASKSSKMAAAGDDEDGE
jgi:hypothetical protein